MRQTKRQQKKGEGLKEFDFFPTRYWRRTEAWESAWRRNLARAPRKHTPEESVAIKNGELSLAFQPQGATGRPETRSRQSAFLQPRDICLRQRSQFL